MCSVTEDRRRRSLRFRLLILIHFIAGEENPGRHRRFVQRNSSEEEEEKEMAGTMRKDDGSSSSSNTRNETVVVDCGRRRSSCGYCRSPHRTSFSHGPFLYSISLNRFINFLFSFFINWICCASHPIRLLCFSICSCSVPPVQNLILLHVHVFV